MTSIDDILEMFRRSREREERFICKEDDGLWKVKSISFERGYQQGLVDAAGQELAELAEEE